MENLTRKVNNCMNHINGECTKYCSPQIQKLCDTYSPRGEIPARQGFYLKYLLTELRS